MPRKKSPVTRPGIDPGTFRLVAQRLNHYGTPGYSALNHSLFQGLFYYRVTPFFTAVAHKHFVHYQNISPLWNSEPRTNNYQIRSPFNKSITLDYVENYRSLRLLSGAKFSSHRGSVLYDAFAYSFIIHFAIKDFPLFG
jgi:hypothetical protein